jgi:hypothetical protein
VRVHFLPLFLCLCAGAVAAEHNRSPRLIAMGCNFDGGLTWLALGKGTRRFLAGFLPRRNSGRRFGAGRRDDIAL